MHPLRRIVDPPEPSEAPLELSSASNSWFLRRGSFDPNRELYQTRVWSKQTSRILWYSPPPARTNNEETPGIDGPESFAFLMSCQTPEKPPLNTYSRIGEGEGTSCSGVKCQSLIQFNLLAPRLRLRPRRRSELA